MKICTTACTLTAILWTRITLVPGCRPVGGASTLKPPWPTQPRHHCSWRWSSQRSSQTNSLLFLAEKTLYSPEINGYICTKFVISYVQLLQTNRLNVRFHPTKKQRIKYATCGYISYFIVSNQVYYKNTYVSI